MHEGPCGSAGSRWFEVKRVLKHLAGLGPRVQKRNFRQGETSRKNQTLEEAQGEVCASYFSLKKALSQEGVSFSNIQCVCTPPDSPILCIQNRGDESKARGSPAMQMNPQSILPCGQHPGAQGQSTIMLPCS